MAISEPSNDWGEKNISTQSVPKEQSTAQQEINVSTDQYNHVLLLTKRPTASFQQKLTWRHLIKTFTHSCNRCCKLKRLDCNGTAQYIHTSNMAINDRRVAFYQANVWNARHVKLAAGTRLANSGTVREKKTAKLQLHSAIEKCIEPSLQIKRNGKPNWKKRVMKLHKQISNTVTASQKLHCRHYQYTSNEINWSTETESRQKI